eukprot:jgi/Mesvir1/25443/Mv01715-RA.1
MPTSGDVKPGAGGNATSVVPEQRGLARNETAESRLPRVGVVLVYCAEKMHRAILGGLSCDTVDVTIYSNDEHSAAGMNVLSYLLHLARHHSSLHPTTIFLKDRLRGDMPRALPEIVGALARHDVAYYAFSNTIRTVRVSDLRDTYMRKVGSAFHAPVLSALQCGDDRPATNASQPLEASVPTKPLNESGAGHPNVPPSQPFSSPSAQWGRPTVATSAMETGWAQDQWRSAVHSVFAVGRDRVRMWPACKARATLHEMHACLYVLCCRCARWTCKGRCGDVQSNFCGLSASSRIPVCIILKSTSNFPLVDFEPGSYVSIIIKVSLA